MVCAVVGHSTHDSMYYKEYSYCTKHVRYQYLPWLLTDRWAFHKSINRAGSTGLPNKACISPVSNSIMHDCGISTTLKYVEVTETGTGGAFVQTEPWLW